MQLLSSPMFSSFRSFAESVEKSCLICSPYIGIGPVQQFTEAIQRKGLADTVQVRVVTDISASNLLSRSTDTSALILMMEQIRNVELVYLPKIHAKVYVAGESLAIIGSANFTSGGLFANLEYGVALVAPEQVAQVSRDINAYARLGAVVTETRLRNVNHRVERLRLALRDEQRSINQQLRLLSDELKRETEDELIRVRVHGRTVNAIFSETILYILTRGPMTTVEVVD